jgi:tetratricopeptide (TPR) repeat protein
MEWYMRAMELEPESVAALRGTEHALRAAGEWRSFLELRRKLIRAAEDERLRLALLHDLEMLDHLHARTLKKAQAVPLLDVEEIDFGTPSVLADLMLEREVIERGDPGSRLRYFEARRDAGAMPASIRLADAFERSEALLQAGLVDEALEALQEMAEQDVPSLVALVLIERIAERAGDEAHLVKASSALGEAFHEPVFKAESLVRRALAKLDSPSEREGALEDLERALELDPDNEQAFTALVQILGADGRWEQLVEEVEGLVERVRRPERAVEVFATLGSLQWRRLGDTAAAVKSYNRVLKHDAMHPPTLMNLVDLYTEEERDNDAIAVCRHLLASSPDGPILVEATIKLADLLDRADRDASEVIEVLEGALEIDPDSRDVLERLARLYRNNNDTDGALSVVDRLVGTEQEPQRRAELLATQAQLLDESGGESEAVLELLERSLEDHPCCETALLRYVEVMEHQQRWEELASRLKEQIERVDPEDVQGRALLLTKLSSVYREHMDDAERGAVTLRQAFDLDARCGETGRMLVGELCDSDRFGDALEVCERMLGDDPLCIEILPGMVHALDQVGESTRAGMVAELASYLGVEDETVTRTALRLRESRTMLGKVTIGGDDLARIRLDAVEHPARSILEVLGEPGSKALRRELSDYGIERADRLDGTSDPGRLLMKECERAARLLDAGAYDVFLIPSQGSEITVEMHRPPALLFSVIVTELSEVEQRILAVQALSRALLRTAPAFKLAAQELEELFIAAARLFDPDFGSDVTGLRMVEELTAELSDALTKKQRKALEPLVERYREGAWLDFEEWHEAMHATTLRLALLAAGDLGAVLDAVKKRDPVLIGVPLTNAQSRREAFARSDQALAVVRFLLDAGTPELWRRYVGDVSE